MVVLHTFHCGVYLKHRVSKSVCYMIVLIDRSPEVNNLKPGKPIVISSEFPSWQNDDGESKGGTLLFKFAKTKKAKATPSKLKVNTMIITQ